MTSLIQKLNLLKFFFLLLFLFKKNYPITFQFWKFKVSIYRIFLKTYWRQFKKFVIWILNIILCNLYFLSIFYLHENVPFFRNKSLFFVFEAVRCSNKKRWCILRLVHIGLGQRACWQSWGYPYHWRKSYSKVNSFSYKNRTGIIKNRVKLLPVNTQLCL